MIQFNNKTVRRQDRLLAEPEAIELLRSGEYGILSMIESISGQVSGYGIPLNYVWDGGNAIYFHCAPQGHKLECLQVNPNASFCVVGHTNVISHKFTTAYESIVVRGELHCNLSPEERMQALLFCTALSKPYI